MLAIEMTAIAKTTQRKSDPVGMHRFAYPAVREISPRRNSPAPVVRTSTGDDGDAALVALVDAARRGDNRAWERLIDRFDPMLRRIARSSFRLAPADVDDVVQATWVLLHSHIDRLREPAAVAGWLVTTVRRQSLRLLQSQAREQLSGDFELGATDDRTPEAVVLEAERHEAVMHAVRTLPDRQRRVMTLLVAQPGLGYRQLGALLQMPIGSVGPTRARGLARLERDVELRDLHAVAG